MNTYLQTTDSDIWFGNLLALWLGVGTSSLWHVNAYPIHLLMASNGVMHVI